MTPSLSLPGFSSPAAGPEDPLAMLSACHERVERQCRTLTRLLPHLAQHGADAQAREAAQAVLRYFDEAAPNHHADEEDDLFGLLQQASTTDPASAALAELTQTLVTQHRQLEQQWRALRPSLQAVAQGQAHTLDAHEVTSLVEAYRAHVALEDRDLLPQAAQVLNADALQRLGQAMSQRRGLR